MSVGRNRGETLAQHMQIYAAEVIVGAAEQREQLAADLARITAQLRAAPVRESVDPQSEAIVQVLAFAELVAQPRDVGYALVLLFALGIELMAALPKSKRAVAAALAARFARCKANGGDVHYGAQLRKGLMVVAAA